MSIMLTTADFDPKRAILYDEAFCPPLHVEQTTPLSAALERGLVAPDTSLLIAEVKGYTLAFSTLHLVYHHVAEGTLGETPFVASFCAICNGGAVFDARLDGERLGWDARGFFNAMTLLGDQQSGSYWDHVRGLCVYGPYAGRQLDRLGTLLHQRAAQSAAAFPAAQFVVATLEGAPAEEAEEDLSWAREAEPEWSAGMQAMLVREDERLPRLEMGLGVWAGSAARYYPVMRLNAAGNLVLDSFGGRRILVFIAPDSAAPEAIYTEAHSARWHGETIRLDTGETIRGGVLYGADGMWQPAARPHQLFYRWYGFALQFPQCDIFAA